MSEKTWKIIKRVLLCASILATIKIILFDYTLDEEYQVVMAYRNLQGDHLFKEMWEPHQTSAFMCIGLMWFYHLITGTYTGVVIFLRVCTTVIQALLAIWGYKVMAKLTKKEYAFLLGIAYFNFVPKQIQIPEFANMQVWFFSIMVLALLEYYSVIKTNKEGKRKNKLWLILSGIGMALEVLAYPSCLLLFPVFLVYIWIVSEKERIKDCLIYIGTCAVCGVLWFFSILRNVSPEEFIGNLGNVLSFDLTHEISGATEGKFAGIISNVTGGVIFLLVLLVLTACIYYFINRIEKKKQVVTNKTEKKLQFLTIAMCMAEVMQMFYWIVLQKAFGDPQFYLVVICLIPLVLWKDLGDSRKMLAAGIIGLYVSLFAVAYISDLPIHNALPHGGFGLILCWLVMVIVWEKQTYVNAKKWIMIFLLGICVTVLVGKGYTVRGGRDYNSVFDTGGIMKNGPAAGILTDYMFAYIYNTNYDEFQQYIGEDEKVMIVTNLIFSAGTTPYMFQESEVCHYSIVDPTAYDERLIEYWEIYPDKAPDVIVVDCWYGTLMEPSDNYIMKYIEEEFGYTEVIDGSYVRFYKR